MTYRAVTRGIEISVEPFHLSAQSDPARSRWVFGYRVTITNQGAEEVQLLTRHWAITDARGRRYEVNGDGVVGKQPRLRPGERFEYASGTPLATPTGFMTGTYGMVTAAGERFEAHIPAFALDVPDRDRPVH